MRDDFTQHTIEVLAKRAGYHCSNPECQCPTVGAAQGHEGFVNVGVASHITAASPGGPRYNPSLTSEERRHQSNGIWLCQKHGKLVDSDAEHFTVEVLRGWKRTAEERSLRALVGIDALSHPVLVPEMPAPKDGKSSARSDEAESLASLVDACQNDLTAFRRMPTWPRHPIALDLRVTDGNNTRPFTAVKLAGAVETFNEIVVIAPPGTGKTTTLLQTVEAVLSQGNSAAIFVPLGEWSTQSGSIFASILRRHAFADVAEAGLKALAQGGRLVLVMDGWNELDPSSRNRAQVELKAMRREFPELGIVLSTRRLAFDAPISGPVVEIDGLIEDQQLEIARALSPAQGEGILDHAWRTPGIRELASIPLYLTALLAYAPAESLPTTKEEVLRLFVREHERQWEKADTLRNALFGLHPQLLQALAVEGVRLANATIPDDRARAAITRVEKELVAGGQMAEIVQPTSVLDTLVSHHVLIRVGQEASGIAFSHQQFQEWYASFDVERLMKSAFAGSTDDRRELRTEVFDSYAWEEPTLFATERLSRTDEKGVEAVGAAILDALTVDPMLAAEMIYRAAPPVWDRINTAVTDFVRRWHTAGTVDRAVRFMITTGHPEFAAYIWPLILNPDSQVYLAALRAAPRFRPSVLGAGAKTMIAGLPEGQRANVLAEIAHWGDMDGIELAAALAREDASPTVQTVLIEALRFRRADRFVRDLLCKASDQVWQQLGRVGDTDIADAGLAERLRHEHEKVIEAETNPLRKLWMLLNASHGGDELAGKIGPLVESSDFPVNDQQAPWVVRDAWKVCRDEVATALVHRLEAGLEIPFRSADLLRAADLAIDHGPIVGVVLQAGGPKRVVDPAVSVVGPKTVGSLIDQLVPVSAKIHDPDKAASDATRQAYNDLREKIANASLASLVQAILARLETVTPGEIGLFASLLARHDDPLEQPRLLLPISQYEQVIAALCRWSEVLVTTPVSKREHLAEVATVMGRIAAPEFVPSLERMLVEDLTRWRHAYEEFLAAHARRQRTRSDAQHSWTLQYRRAFSAIGGDPVVALMKKYLPDWGYCGFGVAAAAVLRDIWGQQHDPSTKNAFIPPPDFSNVAARRRLREDEGTSPFASAIFDVIDRFLDSNAGDEAHNHALQLAEIAFSIPYGDRTATIGRLLELDPPLRAKQKLLTALAMAGEVIPSDLVLRGVKSLLEGSTTKPWLLANQNWWEMEGWLKLIPFTERTGAVFEALDLLRPDLAQPHRLRGLLSALGYSPSPEADNVLRSLPRQDTSFLYEHDWIAALEKRRTVLATRTLFEFICLGAYDAEGHGVDRWTMSRRLANAIVRDASFRAEVYHRYEQEPSGGGAQILEGAIAEVADEAGVLVLLRARSARGEESLGALGPAIRQAAEGRRPSTDWAGATEVFSVGVPHLRKELIGLTGGDSIQARLAAACLTAIDEIHDHYGVPESEPRHPDIQSGLQWPILPS